MCVCVLERVCECMCKNFKAGFFRSLSSIRVCLIKKIENARRIKCNTMYTGALDSQLITS